MKAQQVTLDEARRAAAEAAEVAAAAERALERQVAEADARRQRALIAWDRQQQAEFDYAALTEEVKRTRAEYEAAILADPVNQAAIKYMAAMRIRQAMEREQFQIQRRRGEIAADAQFTRVEGVRLEPKYMADEALRLIESAVGNAVADVMDVLDESRIEAGERAARGEL